MKQTPEEIIEEVLSFAAIRGISVTKLKVSRYMYDYLESLCKYGECKDGESPTPWPREITYYHISGPCKIKAAD